MSKKGSNTTATYLNWEKAIYIINILERNGDKRFALLIGIGVYTGMRIGDILALHWKQLNGNQILLTEGKTGKNRVITLNKALEEQVKRMRQGRRVDEEQYIFINRYGTKPISIQYVNSQLKRILKENKSGLKNVSSHFMRKTFGRRVWDINNRSEESLIKLSEVFCHSTVAITKRYLGIRSEEIADVYLSL